ncbi:uncharacterized protein LTR77_007839 [Saxophila tyrrhenica]|uniref:RING-type domain-containing protein n=1 Tax=Saxophila tyrrhenica TaxID=1690608 RepID=A0AAV9P564_9PEZI|nr:hypothetical protein LTR77_007839 [Saxophila tyrrhenica]
MGQGPSQPERRTEGSGRANRRASVFRRSVHLQTSDEGQQDGLLSGEHSQPQQRTPRLRTRPGSVHRLSQLLHVESGSHTMEDDETAERSRGSAMLSRTRSTIRDVLGRSDRSRPGPSNPSRPTPRFLQHRTSYVRSGMDSQDDDYYPPRLPSIDVDSSFDNDSFPPPEPGPSLTRTNSSARRTAPRIPLPSLRSDRPFRHFPSLRRRRSPQPAIRRLGAAEDQAAMLSRLLSVAAAATAATLMGDDHQALSEARSLTGGTGVGDIGGAGEDGSFDGFLRALQSGRIASALRGGGDVESSSTSGQQPGPLNFFRMFRFGASAAATNNQEQNPDSGQNSEGAQQSSEGGGEGNSEARMVPIIIVGIRSITPGSGSAGSNEDLPPFIDALGSFPSPMPAHALGNHAHDSIDSMLRPPQNGTSFRHRRRASMGGFGMGRNRLNDRMDDQRDHRSPERRRERPWSVASSSGTFEPRPPPATPASPSPELSRISSRNSTPAHSRPTSLLLPGDSRRNSALHRASAGSPLSSHTEETVSLHSTHSSTNLLSQTQSNDAETIRSNTNRRSDTLPNVHYPRFASGHPRRNGVVEPDNLPSLSRASTSAGTDNSSNDRRDSTNDSRSWIIYVLGGSYPENHPILTTPSLFTENPTYEDMMLLSALLGPAKAPVATEEDVEGAGGIYNITLVEPEAPSDAAKTATLVAAAVGGEERVSLDAGQRCLVCLCDFEAAEVARKLVKCGHLFHRECIDQWLTQGRNSCPLCRGQGVDEKPKPAEEESEAATPDATAGAEAAGERVEVAANP